MNITKASMDFSTALRENPQVNMDLVYCALTSSTLSRSRTGVSMFTDIDNTMLMGYYHEVMHLMDRRFSPYMDDKSFPRPDELSPHHYDQWLVHLLKPTGSIIYDESHNKVVDPNGFDVIMYAMLHEHEDDAVWRSSFRMAGFLYERFIRLDFRNMNVLYKELPLFIKDVVDELPYEFAVESMLIRAE